MPAYESQTSTSQAEDSFATTTTPETTSQSSSSTTTTRNPSTPARVSAFQASSSDYSHNQPSSHSTQETPQLPAENPTMWQHSSPKPLVSPSPKPLPFPRAKEQSQSTRQPPNSQTTTR